MTLGATDLVAQSLDFLWNERSALFESLFFCQSGAGGGRGIASLLRGVAGRSSCVACGFRRTAKLLRCLGV